MAVEERNPDTYATEGLQRLADGRPRKASPVSDGRMARDANAIISDKCQQDAKY